ncbi:hypothetical protein LYZ86_12705 [Xanthomonas hortorum pv. cynarae]|uniref:hypothetical protein n=1 Tax=Xanthomonas hortorum TaxID=56454 RepID=UPI000CEE2ABE|nr:hypothetical protein [Xanthomonas hortorum]MCC4623305.1 hypothetical protein [Xanthomonas campestris pv. nigromaculans]MCE4350106.1 hypothetical protein [Xanthomonas hortorum pv. cynarae]PPU38529.1 hypothetical protein XcyCFBP4188_18520 [Xanthomonas hortorum pv. cynarae]CAD0314856.1 hypothetical protein CFBP2044_12520 [Xanthomonas hortorum pv. cynarae]CAD0314864.1 hypothetical protein CFBP2044_12520 [Xanthomonas hortorum pv. cynarae]
MRPIRAAPFLIVAALCGTALCACAHTQADSMQPSPKEHTTMTTHEAETVSNPTLSAEEIGKRLLALIGGLKSRDEISLDRIRDVMHISLKLEPGALGAGFPSGDLGGGWRYVFDYFTESPSNSKGIKLTFVNTADRFADMTAVCSLDFDYYDKSLKRMGFVSAPTHGPIGQLEDMHYVKAAANEVGGDIVISIVPQNVVAGSATRLCVKSISTLG